MGIRLRAGISLITKLSTMSTAQISYKKVRSLPAPLAKRPSATLLLPYNPKMMSRQETDRLLRNALSTAEKKLMEAHPAESVLPIVRKLQQLIRTLNGSTHKVSVVIFVSDEYSKVLYLDMAVEERVLVDEPFLLRDIADHKAGSRDYLIMLLSARESRMYLNDSQGMKLIKSNSPQNVYAYLNEVPERAGNFSDPDSRREVMLNKFLHHMDQGLGAVLKVYPLPVFVIAADRVAGHFSRLTQHDHQIAGYIHKDGIDAREGDLKTMLEPYLADWRATKSQMLLRQLEKAAQAGKLACGIHEARKAAACRNTRLVIVGEEQYHPDSSGFYSTDGIDNLVEKVLEAGGEIEKMDRALLGDYGPVAVIKYY